MEVEVEGSGQMDRGMSGTSHDSDESLLSWGFGPDNVSQTISFPSLP